MSKKNEKKDLHSKDRDNVIPFPKSSTPSSSSSEEDVAKFMGYKISPQKRKLGYRQVKNLKKKFLQVAIEILKEQDIIGDGAE